MKCGNETCVMDRLPDAEKCCDECEGQIGSPHSAECAKRNYPEAVSAEYLFDPNAAAKLVDRLQRATAMATVLKGEFNLIRRISQSLVPGFAGNLEMMVAHLEIDLGYIRAELQRILR